MPQTKRVYLVGKTRKGTLRVKYLRLHGRVAFDLGGVVLNRYSKTGEPLPVEAYGASELFIYARQAIRLLVHLFGAENVFIIKNDGPEHIAEQALQTLVDNDFFEGTGFLMENFLITDDRREKWIHCIDYMIDFMIEDKAEVGRHLPPFTYFMQYGVTTKEQYKHVRAIRRRVRRGTLHYCKVVDWRETVREILSFYDVSLKQILTNRPPEDQADILTLYEELFNS